MLTKEWRIDRCVLVALVMLLVITGCGGEQVGGAGQCGGAASSGICVTIDDITPLPAGAGAVGGGVAGGGAAGGGVAGGGAAGGGIAQPGSDRADSFQNLDCDGDPSTLDPEPFSEKSASVTLGVRNLIPTNIPGTTPGVPTFVTLTQYRLDYSADAGNVQPVPALSPRVFNESIVINVDETEIRLLVLVAQDQKDEFSIGVGNADLLRSYTAKYTFSGQDSLGGAVSVEAFKRFQLGDIDNCTL